MTTNLPRSGCFCSKCGFFAPRGASFKHECKAAMTTDLEQRAREYAENACPNGEGSEGEELAISYAWLDGHKAGATDERTRLREAVEAEVAEMVQASRCGPVGAVSYGYLMALREVLELLK